ncbi:PrpF domain-containing protein [Sinorhizobium mexicanum]|uniref:PrpF family protein n=1 Tax=Sinorhizobium mexicanum TaxID=375549 RepID=A0A859QTW1_9HYPH|nr:PrpF domain-containing protein [Sinorhizobium mexicanum]MBP1883767.1 2-methylaconitate cis-trans-isomerase PrpF [Sinorhizobium mexicanum]QLL62939.1 PrpF family protein [Sinorhizobium mexicanum]
MESIHPQQQAIRAVFMRGGTSKALVFHRKDLPQDRADWDAIFLAAMGSPDPNGRQLDGMGGGLSSLSKVCVIEKSAHPDADIDYLFGQVEMHAARVDYAGSCGSMASAIGPFAADEGLVPVPQDGDAVVRIRDVNADKLIISRFRMRGGRACVDGDFAVDGIAGSGSPVRIAFLSPAGAATGKVLPMGVPVSEINVAGVGRIAYSFVDAANPVMFVAAESIGLSGSELPDAIEAVPGLLGTIERIRRHVTVAAGAAPDLEAAGAVSLPRIAFVARSARSPIISGGMLEQEDTDIIIRMIGRGRPHLAVPITTALCLAVACKIPGTIPRGLLSARAAAGGDIIIGHPSGAWTMAAEVDDEAGRIDVRSASAVMTARRLFQGEVMVPSAVMARLRAMPV